MQEAGEPRQAQPGLVDADVAFGPGFDQVMRDGNRRRHMQVRVFACERGHDLVAAEPSDIGHLAGVDVDVGGQGFAMTADHQR